MPNRWFTSPAFVVSHRRAAHVHRSFNTLGIPEVTMKENPLDPRFCPKVVDIIPPGALASIGILTAVPVVDVYRPADQRKWCKAVLDWMDDEVAPANGCPTDDLLADGACRRSPTCGKCLLLLPFTHPEWEPAPYLRPEPGRHSLAGPTEGAAGASRSADAGGGGAMRMADEARLVTRVFAQHQVDCTVQPPPHPAGGSWAGRPHDWRHAEAIGQCHRFVGEGQLPGAFSGTCCFHRRCQGGGRRARHGRGAATGQRRLPPAARRRDETRPDPSAAP